MIHPRFGAFEEGGIQHLSHSEVLETLPEISTEKKIRVWIKWGQNLHFLTPDGVKSLDEFPFSGNGDREELSLFPEVVLSQYDFDPEKLSWTITHDIVLPEERIISVPPNHTASPDPYPPGRRRGIRA